MFGSKKLLLNLRDFFWDTARLKFGLAVVVSVALVACGPPAKPSVVPSELTPATIAPLANNTLAATTLRVRVYVGADHRARVIGWEDELATVMQWASSLLYQKSAVQLELVESVAWERAGGPLEKTLASLVAKDPGLDVDVVVGLVDAPEKSLADFDSLVRVEGKARHIVLRGFHWQAESAALGDSADQLGETAKEQLLIARRKHKQSVMLAHGVAALFGETAAFGPRYEITIHEIGADAGKRLRTLIPQELAARKEAELRKPQQPEPGALRLIDRENLGQVQLLLEAKKPGIAWEVLEPLLELYPQNAEIAVVGCLVAEARDATDVATRCKSAVSLGGKDPAVYLALARTQLVAEPDVALQNLRRAESLLADDSKQWSAVAKAYKQLSLATHATRAAGKSSDAGIATWARESQARYAINVGVEPNREGDYLRSLKAALAAVYDGNFSKAAVAAQNLTKKFPNSVAGDFVGCELAMHKRKYDDALRACRAVVASHPENSWARYLQGVALARKGQREDAVRMLSEAIDRDVTLEPAYKALGQLYRKGRDKRLAALRAAYKKTFGKTL